MIRPGAGFATAVVLVLAVAGCGAAGEAATVAPVASDEAVLAPSQDRLPAQAPVATGAGDAAAREHARDACAGRIAQYCMQASLHSEAMCRVARCEEVAGFWVLVAPQARVDKELRVLLGN